MSGPTLRVSPSGPPSRGDRSRYDLVHEERVRESLPENSQWDRKTSQLFRPPEGNLAPFGLRPVPDQAGSHRYHQGRLRLYPTDPLQGLWGSLRALSQRGSGEQGSME